MRLAYSLIFAALAYWTAAALQMSRFADDPGVGWHLETGRLIAAKGSVPRTDPFLYSRAPREWIADQWLSDAALAALDAAGSWPLLYGVLTALFIATFMGIVVQSCIARTAAPFMSALAAFIALKLSTIHFILRPVIFAFLLFALLCERLRGIAASIRSGAPMSRRDGLLVVLLFALWANIHPSFALGLVVLGLLLLGLLYEVVVVQRRALARTDAAAFLALPACAALATLLTPFGTALHHQVFNLVGSDFFMQLNNEWRPLDPGSAAGKLFFVMVFLQIIGGIVLAQPRNRGTFSELIVLSTLGWAALQSSRYAPFFAIAGAPLLAAALQNIIAYEPTLRLPRLRRCLDGLNRFEGRELAARRCYAVGLAVVCALPIVLAAQRGEIPPYRGPFGPSRAAFPYGAVEYLRTNAERGAIPTPVIAAATPDWGGFITLFGQRKVNAVIDDRNSLLGEAAYRDYLASTTLGADIKGYLTRVGAQFLILKTTEPLAIYLRSTGILRERWSDETSTVFENR